MQRSITRTFDIGPYNWRNWDRIYKVSLRDILKFTANDSQNIKFSPVDMAESSSPEVLMALEQLAIVIGAVFGFWTGFFTQDTVCHSFRTKNMSLIFKCTPYPCLSVQSQERRHGASFWKCKSFRMSCSLLELSSFPLLPVLHVSFLTKAL